MIRLTRRGNLKYYDKNGVEIEVGNTVKFPSGRLGKICRIDCDILGIDMSESFDYYYGREWSFLADVRKLTEEYTNKIEVVKRKVNKEKKPYKMSILLKMDITDEFGTMHYEHKFANKNEAEEFVKTTVKAYEEYNGKKSGLNYGVFVEYIRLN